MRQTLLTIGEPAPWFTARSTNNANSSGADDYLVKPFCEPPS